MEHKLCSACQWHKAIENESHCVSCKPLVKKFAEEIHKKYGTKENK